MAVPSLDFQPIFGVACTVRTQQRPRQLATEAYFGTGQVGCQDGGARGTTHQVLGVIWGPGPDGLAAAFGFAGNFLDGQAHTFSDALGTPWPGTVLQTYEPVGKIVQDSRGNYGRGFRATLLTLTAQV